MTLLVTFTPAATLPGPWEHHHLINKGLPPEPLTRHNQFSTYWAGTCMVSVMLLEEDTNPPLQIIPMLHICSIFQPCSMDSDFFLFSLTEISQQLLDGPQRRNTDDFADSLTFLLAPTWGWLSGLSVTYLDNYWMDCYEICYIYSRCPQAEPRPDFGDPLTFPLAPPASQNNYIYWTQNVVHSWFPDDVSWGLWSKL